MMMPNIQQLMRKNPSEDSHSPGKKVLAPRNSSWYACCSQAAWPRTQRARAAMPRRGLRIMEELGRYSGRKTMYQRKYYTSIVREVLT